MDGKIRFGMASDIGRTWWRYPVSDRARRAVRVWLGLHAITLARAIVDCKRLLPNQKRASH